MKIKSQKDFYSGLMFLGIGLAFAGGRTHLPSGHGRAHGVRLLPVGAGQLAGADRCRHHRQGHRGPHRGRRQDRQMGLEAAVAHCSGQLCFWHPAGGVAPTGNCAHGPDRGDLRPDLHRRAGRHRVQSQGSVHRSHAPGSAQLPAFVLALKLQFPVWPSFISG